MYKRAAITKSAKYFKGRFRNRKYKTTLPTNSTIPIAIPKPKLIFSKVPQIAPPNKYNTESVKK